MDPTSVATDFNISLITDVIIIAVLLISAGVSFFRGLIREVLTIAGVAGGIVAAALFGDNFVPLMENILGVTKDGENKELFGLIPYEFLAYALAYGAVFLGFVIGLSVLSHFLSKAAAAIGLGPVDRTLGVIFGLARGLLLLAILYMPFYLTFSDEDKKDWFGESKLIVYVQATSEWISGFFPKDEDEASQKTQDIMEKFDILKSLDPDKKADAPDKLDSQNQAPAQLEGYGRDIREKLDNLLQERQNDAFTIEDTETPPAEETESTATE